MRVLGESRRVNGLLDELSGPIRNVRYLAPVEVSAFQGRLARVT